ncbi:uncharacterized protein [Argopecten irradians]|uniref:uncharacterized protein n=1 Tax=Argopecten irradians TaxID=31199 RepID=UPI003722364F
MLGTVLVDGKNTPFCPVPPRRVISSFKPTFNYSVCRTCTYRSGDEAWLSYWDKEQIYRVDQKGNIKEKIECKVKVQSLAVSPSTGRVWFCVKEDKSIREITSDGKIVTHFKVGSIPRSLCIMHEDMVVVGMEWSGIFMYTSKGRRVHVTGHVFRQEAVVPHHMAYSTTTGDVVVVDSDNVSFNTYMAGKEPRKQPRVIVMDKHLKLKFQCRYIDTMESQTGDSQQFRFYPQDVCFNGAGDVLVTEWVTKSVMLIDGNHGHFLRTIYITDGGKPLYISQQFDAILWIGHNNDTRTMEIIKYKK